MPIPSFDHNSVLPPFLDDVTKSFNMSPYPVTVLEVVQRFATSRERVNILYGLLNLRRALRSAGCSRGFQWLDGSFLEDVEIIRGRAPKDIDVVSWIRIDPGSPVDPILLAILQDNDATSKRFHVDHFITNLAIPGEELVHASRFWFGLFSHQRDTAIWKGMLQVDLSESSGDVAALDFLNNLILP